MKIVKDCGGPVGRSAGYRAGTVSRCLQQRGYGFGRQPGWRRSGPSLTEARLEEERMSPSIGPGRGSASDRSKMSDP